MSWRISFASSSAGRVDREHARFGHPETVDLAVERGAAAVQDLIAAVRADTAHDLMVGAAGWVQTDLLPERLAGVADEPRPLIDQAPITFARNFRTPMLIIHGAKDYRVPATQALELYGVLRAKGVPARLVHYPDENHWILKPRNSLHWYGEFLGWLGRHLA